LIVGGEESAEKLPFERDARVERQIGSASERARADGPRERQA
jgi:hypothetical protein